MPCGCSDNRLNNNKSGSNPNNNKLNNNKTLYLGDMRNMSIDEIVKLYQNGYNLEGLENDIKVPSNIVSMDYSSQCSGGSNLVLNNTGSLQGTYGAVSRGRVWAQKFYANYSCLDMVQFSVKRDNNFDLYVEIRKDYGGKPQGIPLQNDEGLVYRTPLISYNDLPISIGWVYFNVPTILPANGAYWICFVPVDFYDSPTYREWAYYRFEIQDRTDISANPSSHYDNGTWTNSGTFGFAVYNQPNYIIPSFATIYDLTTSPTTPAEEDQFTITANIGNTGGNGKVRAVIKVNGDTVSGGDQNSTLGPYPAAWSPHVTYTMPATTITITVDSYGSVDNGTTWIFDQTRSISVTPGALRCITINLTPYSASVEIGQSVTFTATTTPSNQAFTVDFRLVETGTPLGTRQTSAGSCTFLWNTSTPTGLVPGTYHVTAEVAGQCWSTSPGSGIILSAPIQQWTLDINVKDVNTLLNISGASVTVSAHGPPAGTQTASTDLNGNVQLVVTQGYIDVTISKTGYNTRTINDSIYNNKPLQCNITPTTSIPGSLQFVTVPSGAEIFFDTVSKGITNITTGILQIDNLPAGQVVNYTVKKTGYNDGPGSVTVQSDAVLNVPVTLTQVTPTTGDVCVKSNPSGASIKIDSVDQAGKTTAMSGGGCVSSNIIYALAPTLHSYELSLIGFENNPGTFTPIVGTTIDVDAGILTPSQTMGSVTITSTPPGARVYIDNVDKHYVTPATISNIVQGPHTYKLVLAGYIDGTGNFTISAGQTITVPNVTLVQRLGSLKFISTPSGAEILIGGISKGITTVAGLTVSNLPIGLTYFVARLATYDEYNDSIIVQEDIITNVQITLTPSITDEGSLHIESTPPGAEIFIDGTDKHLTTPQTFTGIDTGGHGYKLTLTGYNDYIYTFVISAGQMTPVNVTLVPIGIPPILTSISPVNPTIQIGGTQQFVAKDQNNNSIDTEVVWTKTVGIGAISPTGLYSAGTIAGTATISAAYLGVTITTSITVTSAAIILTSISPANPTIQIGGTQQFVAKDNNNNSIDTGIVWTKTTGVGTISPTGLYSTGIFVGTATISAVHLGITVTTSVTVIETLPQEGGAGMLLGIIGVVALGIMMSSKKPQEKYSTRRALG